MGDIIDIGNGKGSKKNKNPFQKLIDELGLGEYKSPDNSTPEDVSFKLKKFHQDLKKTKFRLVKK